MIMKTLRLLAGACILLTLSGCGLGYYMHLARGQLSLIWGAVPLEEAIERGPLSPEERERLRLIGRVKKFGEETLGLKSTGAYETVYMKSRRNPLYTVSACPKDSLSRITWWFPFVGAMPYIGFFDKESADRKKAELLEQDLDVFVSRANAYSTLGWFNDPVTLNLLDAGPVELAEIILHEMTHTTLYVKGQGEFNEGIAMLVGLVGAARFFEQTHGAAHPLTMEAKRAIEEERRFSRFLDSTLSRLEELYDSPLSYQEKVSRRWAVFSAAVGEFGGLQAELPMHRFARFGSSEINNAYLTALAVYHRRYPLFESFLLSRGGSVKETLDELRRMSADEGSMFTKVQSRL